MNSVGESTAASRASIRLSDTSSNPNNGGVKTYQQSLLPLKDSNGNALSLPRINQGSNVLGLLPAVNFGFPSTGFSAQSSGQGISGAPLFSLDRRWPFTGTDQLQTSRTRSPGSRARTR